VTWNTVRRKFRHLHTVIYGNREFVEHLRSRGKLFDHEGKRERDMVLKKKATPGIPRDRLPSA
jgi:hypothetical protein